MNHHSNNLFGFMIGTGSGLAKYLLQINTKPFLINLSQAALTALICGAAGIAGKEIYGAIKRRLNAAKKRNK